MKTLNLAVFVETTGNSIRSGSIYNIVIVPFSLKPLGTYVEDGNIWQNAPINSISTEKKASNICLFQSKVCPEHWEEKTLVGIELKQNITLKKMRQYALKGIVLSELDFWITKAKNLTGCKKVNFWYPDVKALMFFEDFINNDTYTSHLMPSTLVLESANWQIIEGKSIKKTAIKSTVDYLRTLEKLFTQ